MSSTSSFSGNSEIDINPYPCLALPCPHLALQRPSANALIVPSPLPIPTLSSEDIASITSQISSCLQTQQPLPLKKLQFETLLSFLPLESKTIEFYSFFLPCIFSHSSFSSETLALLLSYQSNLLTFQDHSGNNFLHYLILHSLPLSMIQSLIDYDASLITLTNFCGETCLHLALQASPHINFDLVKFLLCQDPNAVNLPSKSGKLPIHHLFKPGSSSASPTGSTSDLSLNPRDSCLEILLKLSPLSAYSEITEKITRINIRSVTSPTSVIDTPDPLSPTPSSAISRPSPLSVTPPPLIYLIERRWSPYSEATRLMNDENNGKDLYRIDRVVTAHMMSLIHDRKAFPRTMNRCHPRDLF